MSKFSLQQSYHYAENCLLSSYFLGSSAELGSFFSFGSLSYIIMQVILSVPVPSERVISPLAIPWSIISSIINEVSPGGFVFLSGSEFYLDVFKEFLPYVAVFFIVCIFLNYLGPFSRLVLTNLAAYSFVKQSQIPSQATTIKS